MTNPVAVLRQTSQGSTGQRIGAQVYVWCPGCDEVHGIGVPGDDGSKPPVEWTWDGSLEAPMFSPSIKVEYGTEHVCHSYLEGGRWRFLSDSTHPLADRTDVPMVPLPDWLARP